MDDSFLRKMRTSLIELKKEILKNLAAESEDFRTIIEDLDPKDLADIAADDIDRKTLEALGTQELNRLSSLNRRFRALRTISTESACGAQRKFQGNALRRFRTRFSA